VSEEWGGEGWGRGAKRSPSDLALHERLMGVSQDVRVADVFPRLPDSCLFECSVWERQGSTCSTWDLSCW